jgi:CRISPR/Cas system CMR subunit Cmr4 (Cas7 group RAMP superfamily)
MVINHETAHFMISQFLIHAIATRVVVVKDAPPLAVPHATHIILTVLLVTTTQMVIMWMVMVATLVLAVNILQLEHPVAPHVQR